MRLMSFSLRLPHIGGGQCPERQFVMVSNGSDGGISGKTVDWFEGSVREGGHDERAREEKAPPQPCVRPCL